MIIEVGWRADRDEALDLRTAHQKLHADPGAEGEARDPAALGLGVDGLCPVERGRGIGKFPGAVVERPLAAADAAEVEPERREAAVHEGIIELVDDLVVHRPTELRVRVQHDGDRRILLPRRMVPALDPTSRTGEDDLRHCYRPRTWMPPYRGASGVVSGAWRNPKSGTYLELF
jgi:hypothetical protein